MFPDAKWLDALKLPLRASLAVAAASAALLALEGAGVLNLGSLQPFARPFLIVVTVLALSLSVVGLLEPLVAPIRERQRQRLLSERRAARRLESEKERIEAEAKVLARLDHLSKEEIRYVADCLRRNTPSLYAYALSPATYLLEGKGLIWQPVGTFNEDQCPAAFHDFVWTEMLKRKDEFLSKHAEFVRADEAAQQAARRR